MKRAMRAPAAVALLAAAFLARGAGAFLAVVPAAFLARGAGAFVAGVVLESSLSAVSAASRSVRSADSGRVAVRDRFGASTPG